MPVNLTNEEYRNLINENARFGEETKSVKAALGNIRRHLVEIVVSSKNESDIRAKAIEIVDLEITKL